MMGFIRPCLVSGVAVLAASALVVTPVAPLPTRPEPPPVALAALAGPLAAPTTVASIQPFDLAGRQVGFHVGFVADFIVTGAQLLARQVPIPGTLLQDLQNGTPLPVALGRALQTFADVEIDAGRELVGFATEYVNFQVDFLAKVLRDVMSTISNTTIAFASFAVGVVGQLVTSVAAGLTPASAQSVSTAAEPSAVGLSPGSPRQTVPPAATERQSDGRATETTQDSTRAASSGGDTVTERPKAPKQPTSAVKATETATESAVGVEGDARSRPDAAPEHEGNTDTAHRNDKPLKDRSLKDNAPQKHDAPQKDSATNHKPDRDPRA